jgi:hypothetical protein
MRDRTGPQSKHDLRKTESTRREFQRHFVINCNGCCTYGAQMLLVCNGFLGHLVRERDRSRGGRTFYLIDYCTDLLIYDRLGGPSRRSEPSIRVPLLQGYERTSHDLSHFCKMTAASNK